MHKQFRRHALQPVERPDTFFAFVAGLYAAALLSPAVVIGLGLWVTGHAGVLYFGLLAAITLITSGVAWAVTRWRGLPERMGATRLVWGLVLLPIATAGSYFAFVAVVDSSLANAGALVGFFFGLFGMFIGIGLVTMARNRYTAALVDEGAVVCEWKAGWPEPQRHRIQYASIAAMVFLAAVWLVGIVWELEWVGTVGQIIFIPVIVAANVGQPRTYRVTPVGLERSYPASRYVYNWGNFESYAVTDNEIRIRWRSWWRPAIRCARGDLDDEDAVLAALDAHLQRA